MLNFFAETKNTTEQFYKESKNHQTFQQLVKSNKNVIKGRESFCVVRNPYERMVSIYRFIVRPFKLQKWFGVNQVDRLLDEFSNLEKFIENFELPREYWNGCNQKSSQTEWSDGVDKIFKIEESEKIIDFMKSKNIFTNIGHKNRWKIYSGQNKMYRNYFNEKSKKLVSKYFEKDIDLFKYSF